MTEIACAECGQPFVPHLKRKTFCSKTCYMRAYDRHPDDTKDAPKNALCGVCRTPFVKQRRSQGYCSRDCQTKAWLIKNPEKNRKRAQQRRIDKPEWYKEHTPIYTKNHRARVLSTRPWRYMLRSRQSDADRKNLPFNLTDEWAAARWTGKCELTNLEFVINNSPGPHPFSASCDRVKPELGYIQENCRFIVFCCNSAKGSGTDEDLYKIAEALIKNKPQGLP